MTGNPSCTKPLNVIIEGSEHAPQLTAYGMENCHICFCIWMLVMSVIRLWDVYGRPGRRHLLHLDRRVCPAVWFLRVSIQLDHNNRPCNTLLHKHSSAHVRFQRSHANGCVLNGCPLIWMEISGSL